MIDIQLGRWVEMAGIEPRARWTRRLAAFSVIVVALSSVLVWRLADLQLVQGPSFARQALIELELHCLAGRLKRRELAIHAASERQFRPAPVRQP